MGTVKLLEEDEQARIRGLIINKFRGDVEILRPGLTQLEDLTGKPVIGVVPYGHFDIDDEDSLSERLDTKAAPALVNIAVVKLPRLSNFTDFSALSRISGVSVAYADKPAQLCRSRPDYPAGHQVHAGRPALAARERHGGADSQAHAAGTPVFGICGGYQMMGRTVSDPDNTEGGGSLRGMGLLPIDTVFRSSKTTTQTRGTLLEIDGVLSDLSGLAVEGYEIHMGETVRDASAKAARSIASQGRRNRGRLSDGKRLRHLSARRVRCAGGGAADGAGTGEKKGVTLTGEALDTHAYKEQQYDKLADSVRKSLDMEWILPYNGGKSMTGLIHLYCGGGRAKPRRRSGLTVLVRAAGNKVVFAQFLKDGTSGECRVLAKLPDVTVMAANPVGKFSFRMTDAEKRGDSGRAHPHLRCGNRICRAGARAAARAG